MNKKAIKHPKIAEEERYKELHEKEMELQRKRIKILQDPELIIKTVKEIQKDVSGEEDTIIAEIIVVSTRLVRNAIPESTNLLLSDKTGTGKDYVTKKTIDILVPFDKRCHVTKMSKEAFTYWHYKDKDWNWNGKVIHFEDITQQLLNCSTFKTMSSGDNFAVVVKDQVTKEIPINGKPCMILTSHHANPEDEALRRFRIGALDDSNKQTRKIFNKISEKYAGNKTFVPDDFFIESIQQLLSYPVIIPFVGLIPHFFPDDVLMRTQYRCFLDFICGSAIFHQHQREKTENREIIATPDDYMIARTVLIYTTSNPKMIPLSKEYRDIITILIENVNPMTIKEIEVKCDPSKQWLYKHLPKIASTGLIEKNKTFNEKANKDVITYKYADLNPFSIPTWNEIGNKIEEIINKTYKTNKTKEDLLLESWFSTANIKPIKPKNEDGFYLVFHGYKIPFNRKVLTVFTVLTDFLCKSNNKRYEKYYKENDLSLHEKINNLKEFISDEQKAKRKVWHESLKSKFDENFISQCLKSDLLMKLPNNEYIFKNEI